MNRRAAREGSRTCLLVIGMHRSGTSALARVLSLLGADLPKTLMGGSEAHDLSNPTGHWESSPIVRLNDEILDSGGLSWRSPEPLSEQWLGSGKAAAMKQAAIRAIEEEFGGSSLFVLKDPRISKLLPIWLQALSDLGINAKILVAIRSPRAVGESLQRRNGIDPTLGELLWAHYSLAAEQDSRSVPRAFVSYDALLRDWQNQAERIERSLKVDLPRRSSSTDINVDRFLSDALRHHVEVPRDAVGAGSDRVVGRAYSILSSWAETKESKSEQSELDLLREQLSASLASVGRPVFLAFEQSAQIQKLQRIRSTLESEKAALVEQLSLLESEKAVLVDELSSLNSNVDVQLELHRRASEREVLAREELTARLEAAELLVKRSDAERDRAELRLGQIEIEKSHLDDRVAGLEGDLEQRRLAAEKLQLERQELAARLETIQLLVQSSDAERDRLLNQLKDLRREQVGLLAAAARLEQHENDSNALRAALGEAQKRLRQLDARVDRLQQNRAAQLAGRDDKIVRLRARLDQFEKNIATLESDNALLAQQLDHATRFLPSRLLQWFRGINWSGAIGAKSSRKRQLQLLYNSPLFDTNWYLARYTDVEAAKLDPAAHFLDHGAAEGRSPSAAFHGPSYLNRYPDVLEAGLNPLIHYIEHGQREGRKIRAVGTSPVGTFGAPEAPSESVPEPLPAGKGEIVSSVAQWSARSLDFSQLDGQLDRSQTLSDIQVKDGEQGVWVAGTCIAKARQDEDRQTCRAALEWLEHLSSLTGRPMPGIEAAVRPHLCGGQLEIADIWFTTDFELRLRLERPAGDLTGPVLIRGFQIKPDSALASCGEAYSGTAGILIFDVSLENRFRPVLIVATDPEGRLLDSCLIPFPSLARGGVHHPELGLLAEAAAGQVHPQLIGTELLDALVMLADGKSDLAVGRIAVDLSEATGNEAIFSSSLGQWLVQDLGIRIEPRNVSEATRWIEEALASHEADGRSDRQRSNGATLCLPSNTIPSIQALLASQDTEENNCSTSFLIADRVSRDPIMQWILPVRDPLPLETFDIPTLQSAGKTRQCLIGNAVLAICFMTERDSDARALFPVSRDAPLPHTISNSQMDSQCRTVTAVISGEYDVASLRALCHSLEQQVGEFKIDLIISCSLADGQVSDLRTSLPVQVIKKSGGNPWSRLCKAADMANGQKILFLDGHTIFHDQRTLDALWSLSLQAGIGTVGCALVSEINGRKGAVSFSTSAGYLAHIGSTAETMNFAQPGFPFSLLPSQLLLAANSQRCALMDRQTWEEFSEKCRAYTSDDPWLELGLELVAAGNYNLCTTQVVASAPSIGVELLTLPRASGPVEVQSSIAAFRKFRR